MCAISAKNVFKKYITGNGKNILFNDVSLQIMEGEIIYVSGDFGSGKTTLLKMIAAMTPPNEGTIEVFGRNLLTIECRTDWRLKHIGFLTNSDALIPYLTVRQHLFMGLDETTPDYEIMKDDADFILSTVGLCESQLDLYPEHLLNFERLKITLARVLMTNPRILLLDEFASELNDEELFEFHRIFVEFARMRNITIVLTGERVHCDIADRILKLENGKILEVKHDKKNMLH